MSLWSRWGILSRYLAMVILVAVVGLGAILLLRNQRSRGIQGFWSGNVKFQGEVNHLPAQIILTGKGKCLLLRHRDCRLHLELSGHSESNEPIQLSLNRRQWTVPIHNGKFHHSVNLTAQELGSDVLLHLRFSHPKITIDTFQVEEDKQYPKMIVVGLDGATWRVLKKLVAAHQVPHFESLMKSGSYGVLNSIDPTLSPVVWTSIATGKTPEEHGIHDFLDDEDTPVQSAEVRVKRIWNMISQHSSLTVGVCGWFVTWPAERISGFMVSDRAVHLENMDNEEATQSFFPPELRHYYQSVLKKRYAKSVQADECKRFTSFPYDVHFTADLNRSDPLYRKHTLLALRLFHVYMRDTTFCETGLRYYNSLRPDVFFLYLRGNDYTQHAYWSSMAPEESAIKPDEIDQKYFKDVITNYYRYEDEWIGKFMDAVPANTTFVIVSDHGFHADPGAALSGRDLSGGHEKQGVYIFSGPGFRRNLENNEVSIMDLCPLWLYVLGLPVARDMAGRVPLELRDRGSEPRFIAGYGSNGSPQEKPVRSGADEEIKEQLRTLGYIQ